LNLEDEVDILQGLVNDGNRRLTHKIRKSHYYGGIATVDVVGCYLNCAFCWVPDFKREVESIKNRIDKFDFASPEECFRDLKNIAEENDLESVRLSGGEPTLNKEHLLQTIDFFSDTKYDYIFETNGILLDEEYVDDLSDFKDDIYVYFSLKGNDPETFERLTDKDCKYWEEQLNSIKLLTEEGFRLGLNVMSDFISKKEMLFLMEKLRTIDPLLPFGIDIKKTSIFPHVEERLNERGIKYQEPEVDSVKYDKILRTRYSELYDNESENIIDKGGMTFFDFR